MTFEKLVSLIDLDRVDSVLDDPENPLADYELDDVRGCLIKALEAWTINDVGDLEILDVEKQILVQPGEAKIPALESLYGEAPQFSGTCDLVVRISERSETFRKYRGKLAVVDWKTSSGLTDLWRSAMIMSWQWKIYAFLTGAEVFIYRGIERAKNVRELLIEVPENVEAQVKEYLEQSARAIGALKDDERWPRVLQTHACHAFRVECPYLKECLGYKKPVLEVPKFDRPLRYTYLTQFWLCPERFRRDWISEADEYAVESRATRFGQAFHRGMAEVYQQVKELQSKEKDDA